LFVAQLDQSAEDPDELLICEKISLRKKEEAGKSLRGETANSLLMLLPSTS
jgi:hypothetical protein